MRFKLIGLSLSCLLVSNLSAFTLDGSIKALEDGSMSFGVKYAQSEQSLIGKVTHKKIIECEPGITGAFEYGSNHIPKILFWRYLTTRLARMSLPQILKFTTSKIWLNKTSNIKS